MQMSLALFPFGGLGHDIVSRITIIGVRFATIKLALMCSSGIYGAALPQDIVVRVIQSLSRLLDHLGYPDFAEELPQNGLVLQNKETKRGIHRVGTCLL